MDIRFLPHNRHLEGIKTFRAQDPQLRLLGTQPFIFESGLIAKLPNKTPGIYSLGGGRQIGKTTLDPLRNLNSKYSSREISVKICQRKMSSRASAAR